MKTKCRDCELVIETVSEVREFTCEDCLQSRKRRESNVVNSVIESGLVSSQTSDSVFPDSSPSFDTGGSSFDSSPSFDSGGGDSGGGGASGDW